MPRAAGTAPPAPAERGAAGRHQQRRRHVQLARDLARPAHPGSTPGCTSENSVAKRHERDRDRAGLLVHPAVEAPAVGGRERHRAARDEAGHAGQRVQRQHQTLRYRCARSRPGPARRSRRRSAFAVMSTGVSLATIHTLASSNTAITRPSAKDGASVGPRAARCSGAGCALLGRCPGPVRGRSRPPSCHRQARKGSTVAPCARSSRPTTPRPPSAPTARRSAPAT